MPLNVHDINNITIIHATVLSFNILHKKNSNMLHSIVQKQLYDKDVELYVIKNVMINNNKEIIMYATIGPLQSIYNIYML